MENLKSILLKIVLPIIAIVVVGTSAFFIFKDEEPTVPNNDIENNGDIIVDEDINDDKEDVIVDNDNNDEDDKVVSDDSKDENIQVNNGTQNNDNNYYSNNNNNVNNNTGNNNTSDDNTGDDNTGDDNTGDDNTGDDNTGDDNTGDDNTGDDNTGDDNTGDNNTGDDNTGDDNTGDDNTGDNNTGDDNTGDDNTGDDNTGDDNTGDDNTGDDNTGDDNTGDDNTGDDNTGDDNTGDDNTGDDNTGDDNTGDDNTGDDNTGDDNTGDDNTGDDNTGDDNTGDDNTGNDDTEDNTQFVTPSATFTNNGTTATKEASTIITATGDYTKIEYSISTINNESSVTTWIEYTQNEEIVIPNDMGNVYVIVRLTAKEDNTYKYVVSEVFEMLPWIDPTVEFSIDSADGQKSIDVSLTVEGDYVNVEYAISETNNENDVTTWEKYNSGDNINLSGINGTRYIIVRTTKVLDGSYIYVKSGEYNMIPWENPTVEYSVNGNTTEASSHTTSINVTGDYTSIRYGIAKSKDKDLVSVWKDYTNNTELKIYNIDGSDLYLVVEVTDKYGNVSYDYSNGFNMVNETLIQNVGIDAATSNEFVDGVRKKVTTYTINLTNNLTANVTSVKYSFWTDDNTISTITGNYDMTSSSIVTDGINTTDANITNLYVKFTIIFEDGTSTEVNYEQSV